MKVTLEEIARIAGVSKATVSRVVNNVPDGVGAVTRARVQEIIQRMHYSTDFSNESIRSMQSCSIALVIPDVANPFFADIAKAVETKAREHGYITILSNTDFSEENEVEYLKNLVAKKVDGIILVSSCTRCQQAHLLPQRYGIPLILLDRKLDGNYNWPGVYFDNELASFRCCEMLIKGGSSQIAFLSGPPGVSTSTERITGYQMALKQYHCSFNPDLIKYGDYTVESGYKAVIELERAGIPYSAILAANDLMALGALNAMKEFSRNIPDEVELIGFDNIMFSRYFDPPLSTVQQPTWEMGTKAIEMLLSSIRKEKVENSVRLDPRIVIRKTTRARRNG